MILGRVTGTVHGTIKNSHLQDHRMLVVRPVDLSGVVLGKPVVAVDRVDAGVGDLVLVCREGGSARMVLGNSATPVQALIVAVVDDVELSGDGP